jgi:hypothetical protein
MNRLTGSILLTLFVLLRVGSASAQSLMLEWQPPTTNQDGTPLTTLAGYYVEHGASATTLSTRAEVRVGNAGLSCTSLVCTYRLSGLQPGTTRFIGVRAFTSAGQQSALSNIISALVPGSVSPTPSISASPTPQPSVSVSPTRSASPSASPSASSSASVSPTRSAVPSASPSASLSPGPSASASSSPTGSATPVPSGTVVPSPIPSPSSSSKPSPEPTGPKPTPSTYACLDSDGDGKNDLYLLAAAGKPGAAHWHHVIQSNGDVVETSLGVSGDLLVPADYDGDGKLDLALAQPQNGRFTWRIRPSASKQEREVPFRAEVDFLLSGCDFDGDKKADIAGAREDGLELVYLSSESQKKVRVALKVPAGHQIQDLYCADFDLDGTDDLLSLTRNPATSTDSTSGSQRVTVTSAQGARLFLKAYKTGTLSTVFAARMTRDAAPVVAAYRPALGATQRLSFFSWPTQKGERPKATYVKLPAFGDFVPLGDASAYVVTTKGELRQINFINNLIGTPLGLLENQLARSAPTSKPKLSLVPCIKAQRVVP